MKDTVLVFGKKLPIKDLLAHRDGVVLAGSEVIFKITKEDMAASEAKLNEAKDKKEQSTIIKAPELPKSASSNPPQPQSTTAMAAATEKAKEKPSSPEKGSKD
jgi:hypothetical protein